MTTDYIHSWFPESWIDALGENLVPVLQDVGTLVSKARLMSDAVVLPEAGSDKTFKAFRLTPYDEAKVVVIGQDIYHTPGIFNGVAFGNGTPENPTAKIQPSLRNIIKEAEKTYGGIVNPSLYDWAEQGVLLINTAHTVLQGQPGTHIIFWKEFTDLVIEALNKKDYLVWMLWGTYAHGFQDKINENHGVVKTGHPSPLNRTNPFVGSGCFKTCDKLLKKNGKSEIKWTY